MAPPSPRGVPCGPRLVAVLLLLAALGFGVRAGAAAQLCAEYYDRTCPGVHRVVRRVLKKAHEADARIYASLPASTSTTASSRAATPRSCWTTARASCRRSSRRPTTARRAGTPWWTPSRPRWRRPAPASSPAPTSSPSPPRSPSSCPAGPGGACRSAGATAPPPTSPPPTTTSRAPSTTSPRSSRSSAPSASTPPPTSSPSRARTRSGACSASS
ncbi:lysine-rich arabinogalactan protein 19-like [Panicum virgatum]|uniref:lysine-rich arabinogalactan protein 19-like n=1 Tax=Panicum virgatum TaxID=38727 RepID=UPI0019D68ECB|nr:lysine-rich arabinogalactan protein 19-like [Panicum virgatum]